MIDWPIKDRDQHSDHHIYCTLLQQVHSFCCVCYQPQHIDHNIMQEKNHFPEPNPHMLTFSSNFCYFGFPNDVLQVLHFFPKLPINLFPITPLFYHIWFVQSSLGRGVLRKGYQARLKMVAANFRNRVPKFLRCSPKSSQQHLIFIPYAFANIVPLSPIQVGQKGGTLYFKIEPYILGTLHSCFF